MRTTIALMAVTCAAVLAAWWYHESTVDRLTADLQAEIGQHAITRGKLTACQSASAAACAVARAQEGKADAREVLGDLIRERRK